MKKLREYKPQEKVQVWVRDAWNDFKGEWKPAIVVQVKQVLPQRGPEYNIVQVEVERKYWTDNTGYFKHLNHELVIEANEIKSIN